VTVSGKEQGHGMFAHLGDNAGGKYAGARTLVLRDGLAQVLHPHGSVIVVEQVALGSVVEEGLINRFQGPGGLVDQFPLRRGGQGNAEILLQFLDPVHWQAGAVTQEP
jgi:hypothetical protein